MKGAEGTMGLAHMPKSPLASCFSFCLPIVRGSVSLAGPAREFEFSCNTASGHWAKVERCFPVQVYYVHVTRH